MKFRNSGNQMPCNFIIFYTAAISFVLLSCNSTVDNTTTDDDKTNSVILNQNPDWTGTYTLNDRDIVYTLKLHKRSVDGSYEMQWYDNTGKSDLYKSSIYDAKDNEKSITVRYLNNFHADATSLGYKSGDTLVVLYKTATVGDSTAWKKFRPQQAQMKFNKVSDTY